MARAPHPETVSRVMELRHRFGKDETKIVKRRGTRRGVFTKLVVADLESTNEESRSITDVVTPLRRAECFWQSAPPRACFPQNGWKTMRKSRKYTMGNTSRTKPYST